MLACGERPIASTARPSRQPVRVSAFFRNLKFSLPSLPQARNAPRRPHEVVELLELVTSPDNKSKQVEARVRELAQILESHAAEQEAVTTEAALLSATWRLVWTTEKETLFIKDKAGFFGTEAGDIYQVIDVEAGLLQNVITFPPEGAFIVNSSISVDGPRRVQFKFNSAKLRLPGDKALPLPPFGKGWFDNVYIDDEIRVARDVRDDVLVVARDGAPRIFS